MSFNRVFYTVIYNNIMKCFENENGVEVSAFWLNQLTNLYSVILR